MTNSKISKGSIVEIKKDVRKLKKTTAAEIHSATFSSPITTAAAGTVTFLSTIAQGDTEVSRAGNAIAPLSFGYRYTTLAAAGGLNTYVRYIIFQDSQNQGVVPVATDVLAAADISSMYNINNELQKRFHIYKDWTQSVQPPNIYNSALCGKGHIKSLNRIMYSGATAAVTDARKGALFLLRITSAGANQPTSDFHWNLKFNP